MDRPSRNANGRGRSCLIGIFLAMGAVWLVSCADDPDPIEPQNRPPVVLQEMPDLYLEDGTADTVNVWEYFLDPDGDALSYTAVSADPGVAAVAVDGTALVVQGVAQGWVVITVTATDSGGLEASTDLFVEVKGLDWRILVELLRGYGRTHVAYPGQLADGRAAQRLVRSVCRFGGPRGLPVPWVQRPEGHDSPELRRTPGSVGT